MNLQAAERWARRAGAAWLIIVVAAVSSGFLRGTRRAKGLTTEGAPAPTTALLRGSPQVLVPVTLVSLAILRLLWRPVRGSLPGWARLLCLVLGSLLYFPGMALTLWGRVAMGEMHNVSSSAGAQLYADHRLVTAGPFALMRHPMYVGGILAEIGALLLYRTWTTLLMTLNAPVLPIRARREEELLAARFGADWEQYAARVPGWVPRLSR